MERMTRLSGSRDTHYQSEARSCQQMHKSVLTSLSNCSLMDMNDTKTYAIYKGGHCSVFKTSEGLAQVFYCKLLGTSDKGSFATARNARSWGWWSGAPYALQKLWEQLKWENILLLNWFTWKTNLIVSIRTWVQ